MNKPLNIVYTDWNIANNFGSVIEVNRHLPKYPRLFHAILKHELKHNNSNFKQDLVTDFGESKVSNIELLSFIIHHPKALSQFLPFYWSKKWGFVYDLNYCLIYLVSIIVLYIVTLEVGKT